jgi:stage V sporulation protein D (sporulation-specific penicillin-binding protein)
MQPIDRKIRWFMAMAFVLYGVVLLRLFWIQVIDHDLWSEKARKQHILKQKIVRKRGAIHDRFGNVLAYTAAVKQLICDPMRLQNPESTLALLSTYTNLQTRTIMPRLKKAMKNKRRYFLVKEDVTLDEFHRIRERIEEERKILSSPESAGLLANCVYFRDSTKRYYPYNMIASSLLGFVGRDGEGLEGVELFYEEMLKGKNGVKVYERGLNGLVIPNSERTLEQPDGGTSIYMTIDVVIQYLVEKKLREAYEQHRPKNAVIVVMNPWNGEVLAMASQPNFNPNYFPYYTQEDYKNRSISDQFEPGSTMKVITLAAALESHAINTEDLFSCVGYIELYDVFRIHCDGRQAHGDLTPGMILKKSCNVGAIQIAQRLGTRRLFDYLSRFGFGEKTGVQLPGEIRGVNRPPEKWSGLSLAALSIGQETAVNTLQLLRAFSSIVNGGVLYHPKILTKTKTFERVSETIEPMPVRRVISKETSRTISDMLKHVTEPGGSGRRAAIPGYGVLGKTGTAQSLAEMHKETSAWDDGLNPKVVASFIGAIPAEDPQLVMYVVVNEPQGEKYYGGQVAAPIFKELGREILTYLEIPPSRSNLEDESREDPVPTADSILRESNEDPLPQWPDEPLHPEVAPAIEQAIEEMPDWINLASRNEELTAQRTLAGSSTVQEVPVSGVLRTDEFVNMLIAEEGR